MKDNVIRLVLQQVSQGYLEQAALYQTMYRLALEQEKSLQASEIDSEKLLDLINQRQELIKNLEDIQKKMAGLKEEIVAALGIEEFTVSRLAARMEEPVVAQLVETMENLAGLLGRIKELDKHNEEALRSRIKETAEKLNQIQQGKKARKAYQPQLVDKDGVFVDFSK